MVGTFGLIIDDEENVIGNYMPETESERIKEKLIKENQFLHTSVTVRKNVLNKVGFYNEKYVYSQDYELWLRISESYSVANIGEFLVSKRISVSSIGFDKEKEQLKWSLYARWDSIKRHAYPWYCLIYLLYPSIKAITPQWLLKSLRKTIFKNRSFRGQLLITTNSDGKP